MPASLQIESGNLIRIRISGVLRQADLKEFQAVAAREIARVGEIKAFFLLEKFEGWEKGVDWGDLTFFADHDKDIEKIAIVGDEKWRDEGLAFAGEGLREAKVRFFSPPERALAKAWLMQNDRDPSSR